jgi:nitrogen fixation protein FixH
LFAGVGAAQSDSGQSSSQSQSGSSDKSSNGDKSSSSDKKDKADAPTTRLRIEITDPNDKPVGNASVYIRFNQPGGAFHKDKLAELNLKTNEDGSAKVPQIPQGKILIQVIAKGWRTYGKWYDIDKTEDTIEIKLENPPHWY